MEVLLSRHFWVIRGPGALAQSSWTLRSLLSRTRLMWYEPACAGVHIQEGPSGQPGKVNRENTNSQLKTFYHISNILKLGLCSLTICLVVQSHELHPVEPEDQGVGIGGVDARGGRVGPQQLAGGVLDQLLGIAPAEPLGSVLVQGRDVVALGCPDDGTEGSWRVVGTARIFPRLPHRIKRTWKINRAQGKAARAETPELQCFLVEHLCVLWLW